MSSLPLVTPEVARKVMSEAKSEGYAKATLELIAAENPLIAEIFGPKDEADYHNLSALSMITMSDLLRRMERGNPVVLLCVMRLCSAAATGKPEETLQISYSSAIVYRALEIEAART